MRQQTLRFGDSWARIAPWRGGEGAAHLVMGPDAGASTDVIQRCLEQARAAGYRSVLTSAVAANESRPFVDAGFAVREHLYLLTLDLVTARPTEHAPVVRAKRRDRAEVLAVDDAAFDPFWRLGPDGLRDALAATPVSRYRIAHDHSRVAGYAITGRSADQGYLQRVAVHPDARRCGWGRALVADALAWLWRHGTRRAYVNTQLENHGAVALYESFGFTRLPHGLCVLGRSL